MVPPHVTHTPLAVIGAGPTGTAALFHAALDGLPAVGFEAGDVPLADVHAYPAGVTLLSPNQHYEVAGLPLDCRHPLELTREDVVSYYTRLIAFGRLDIRCRHVCARLEPQRDGVAVRFDTPLGPDIWMADRVLVTSWFRRRRAPRHWRESGLTIVEGITEASRLVNRRVVIVGGGLSAYEQAVALMHTGQRIAVVARRALHKLFEREAVTSLVAATGTDLIAHADDIDVTSAGVRYRTRDGVVHEIACDVVVTCLGRELDTRTLDMLVEAGVLSGGDAEALVAVTATDPAPGAREREQVVARWPDLWRQLTRGVNGVHLAGGGLHVGGGGAGVQTSILTARLAVDAMLGRPLPPAVTSPLAAALYRLNTRGTPVSEIEAWFDRARGWRGRLAADVCPLAVRSWSRCGIKPHTAQEDAGGSLVDRCADTRQPDEYLVAVPHLDRTVVAELLRVSDGTQTVRALAVDAGFDVDQLLEWMQALWQHNALTWLPPQEGLTAVVRCRLSDSGPEET